MEVPKTFFAETEEVRIAGYQLPELPPPPERPPPPEKLLELELELHEALLELDRPKEKPPTLACPLVFRSSFAFSYQGERANSSFASGKPTR